MTDQVPAASYDDVNLEMVAALVNDLAVRHAWGRPASPGDPHEAVRRILSADPPTAARYRRDDLPGFRLLGTQLRAVFAALQRGDLDRAATDLNAMLEQYPARPHLAKEQGVWRLHHHPHDARLVPMIAAACTGVMARLVGEARADRLGTCEASSCDRVFYDASKNGVRRFCSTMCQNRVKAAAFRHRRAGIR